MIQSIIDDTKDMECGAIVDEENAQKAYEDFIEKTNAATKEKELQGTNEKAESQSDDIFVESTEAHGRYQPCDVVKKNSELCQSACDDEVLATNQAIAILSSARFDE